MFPVRLRSILGLNLPFFHARVSSGSRSKCTLSQAFPPPPAKYPSSWGEGQGFRSRHFLPATLTCLPVSEPKSEGGIKKKKSKVSAKHGEGQ